MRRLVVAISAVAALAFGADAALGCSCAGGTDPREDLANADAAFYGEALSRTVDEGAATGPGKATYRFRVDRSYKGDLSGELEIETSASGASCGLEVAVGERVGLLLRRGDGGRWTSGLCSQRTREQLEAGLTEVPPPDGSPPVRFLVGGRFGTPRSAALDASGRVVAYGMGDGDVRALAPCPGGEVVLELVAGLEGRIGVAARDTDSLAERSMVLLELRGADQRQQVVEDATALRCLDADGTKAAVVATDYGSATRLIIVEGEAQRTIWRGRSATPLLGAAALFADAPGRALVRVDLATGRERRLARAPRGALPAAVSPDGTRLLAGLRGRRYLKAGLRLLDTRTGRTLASRARGRAEPAQWIDDGTVAIAGSGIVADRRLRRIGSLSRSLGMLAADGRQLFGLSAGKLRRIGRDGRRQGATLRLFSADIFAFAALPPAARAVTASARCSAWGALRPASLA